MGIGEQFELEKTGRILPENIAIGTHSDNMQDMLPEQRSIIAGNASRKYPHDEIKQYYATGKTYKEVMEKFGITSKGTVSYIINKT